MQRITLANQTYQGVFYMKLKLIILGVLLSSSFAMAQSLEKAFENATEIPDVTSNAVRIGKCYTDEGNRSASVFLTFYSQNSKHYVIQTMVENENGALPGDKLDLDDDNNDYSEYIETLHEELASIISSPNLSSHEAIVLEKEISVRPSKDRLYQIRKINNRVIEKRTWTTLKNQKHSLYCEFRIKPVI